MKYIYKSQVNKLARTMSDFTQILVDAKLSQLNKSAEYEQTKTNKQEQNEVYIDLLSRFVDTGVQFVSHYNEIKTYWKSLGLSHCTYKSKFIQECDGTDIDRGIEFVKQHNPQFFRNIKTPVPCAVWTIDGTCATGKTSSIPNMHKANRNLCNVAINTHISSATGYIFSAIQQMYEKPFTVWDRSAYNNLYWLYYWLILAHIDKYYDEKYKGNYKNSHYTREPEIIAASQRNNPPEKWHFTEVLSDEVLYVWHNYMRAIHPYIRNYMAKQAKHIIIVDSNEQLNAYRLQSRGTGTDIERANMKHYLTVQNYGYADMALSQPEWYCLIDLAAFDGDQSLMQEIVKRIIDENKPVLLEQSNTSIGFTPLKPDCIKPYLNEEGQKNERLRPLTTHQFTNDTKLFIHNIANNDCIDNLNNVLSHIEDY